jgi:phage minor structural protein
MTASILAGSRWAVGSTVVTTGLSTTFYYLDRWACLQKIKTLHNVEIGFHWNLGSTGITGRFVDILTRKGAARGKRFELDKDIDNVSVKYDDRRVYTALYGRGKGEEVSEDDNGDPNYGRSLTFEDVIWTIADGDPTEKPSGQRWVEDTAATAMYGRKGRKRVGIVEFKDCEDPEELLTLTWEHLQKIKYPDVQITATVKDLESQWGYYHEAVRLGDDVAVILVEINDLQVYATVQKLKRDLLKPENTQVVIGNYRPDIIDGQLSLAEAVATATQTGQIGAAVAVTNPDFLNGILDTMVTKIISSGTRRYTDTDGAEILETADGNLAVKLAGAGILLARSKEAGVWNWRTAITGEGIVADEVNTGTLRAGIIFSGELNGASGTFTTLLAGNPVKAHLRMGVDSSGDPIIEVYDDDNILKRKISHLGDTFGNTSQSIYALGSRSGIGVFIV